MFTIETNLREVAIRLQNRIEQAERNISGNLLEAATDGMVAVSHRIQHEGRNSSGEVMRTKSPRYIEAYSKAAALLRRKKGRQIDHIDFTFEGDLMRNYNILRAEAREVVVGFLDLDMAHIAGDLEA